MDKRDPSICRKYDPATSSNTLKLAAIIVPSIIVACFVVVYLVATRRRRHADSLWEIDPKELHFSDPPEILGRGTFGLVVLAEYRGTQVAVKRVIPPRGKAGRQPKNSTFGSTSVVHQPIKSTNMSFIATGDIENQNPMVDGRTSTTMSTQGRRVNLFTTRGEYSKLKADFIVEMRRLSKLRHPSITTVMGAVIDRKSEPSLVMEDMDHGSLYDLLHNDTISLEGDLLLPILRDIAQGLRFLHAADPVVVHGDLKAQNVLIDSRFRAKVTDFGLSAKQRVGVLAATKRLKSALTNRSSHSSMSGPRITGTPFWMAPELLRGDCSNSISSDVYSFGILLYEMYSRKEPYEGEEVQDVLRAVADRHIQKRPPVPAGCPSSIASVMKDCLVGDPELRPSFDEIDNRIKRMDTETADPGDQLLSRGTKKMITSSRNQDLLFKIFPKHIAEALRDGRKVEPERKDLVTICFSDIIGFTEICALLTPEKVSDLLDRLYTKFDQLSNQHGVFKMETIGDAYMGVTNLVDSQDEDHVKRMALFAFAICRAASSTLIDQDNQEMGTVQIRVGFHSGPVIARVVGTRNPKYAIFGDTVNTAARMESTSHPGEIHCSERAAELLRQQCPGMKLRSRGSIAVKGKGEMRTFFVKKMASEESPSSPSRYTDTDDTASVSGDESCSDDQ